MKFTSEYWEFSAMPTFIKAAPTRKNRYADGFRIYSSTERFLADFGDDIEATRCASYFKENCNGKTVPLADEKSASMGVDF